MKWLNYNSFPFAKEAFILASLLLVAVVFIIWLGFITRKKQRINYDKSYRLHYSKKQRIILSSNNEKRIIRCLTYINLSKLESTYGQTLLNGNICITLGRLFFHLFLPLPLFYFQSNYKKDKQE